MERRNFLKNLLGAGMIAVIPIPVFEALATTSVPVKNKWSKLQNGLWLLEGNKVLAFTSRFSLDVIPNLIDITSCSDTKEQYITTPPSWNISGSYFYQDVLEILYDNYFLESKTIDLVVVQDKIGVCGQGFITEISSELKGEVNFQGVGTLTLTLKEGNENTPKN